MKKNPNEYILKVSPDMMVTYMEKIVIAALYCTL